MVNKKIVNGGLCFATIIELNCGTSCKPIKNISFEGYRDITDECKTDEIFEKVKEDFKIEKKDIGEKVRVFIDSKVSDKITAESINSNNVIVVFTEEILNKQDVEDRKCVKKLGETKFYFTVFGNAEEDMKNVTVTADKKDKYKFNLTIKSGEESEEGEEG